MAAKPVPPMRTIVVANIKKVVAENGELASGNAFGATGSNQTTVIYACILKVSKHRQKWNELAEIKL